MISSEILSGFNADGDHQNKRFKTLERNISPKKNFLEEFFFQSHPFSDLILLVQDKELYVDKSVLAAGSKVFQSYFEDDSIDSIEILDVTANEMMELLQFLYPQFPCTINNENVTILLILAHRFELHFISSACRTFLLLYLSKLKSINIDSKTSELIEQEDGTRLTISSILENLCIWYREFFFMDDIVACQAVLNKLIQSQISTILQSNGFMDLEEKIKWKMFQARAKYLERYFNPQTTSKDEQ